MKIKIFAVPKSLESCPFGFKIKNLIDLEMLLFLNTGGGGGENGGVLEFKGGGLTHFFGNRHRIAIVSCR